MYNRVMPVLVNGGCYSFDHMSRAFIRRWDNSRREKEHRESAKEQGQELGEGKKKMTALKKKADELLVAGHDASLRAHVHWYRYLCLPVNHVKVVWFVVGFYGGELKRSFRHRHSRTVTVSYMWVIFPWAGCRAFCKITGCVLCLYLYVRPRLSVFCLVFK